MLYNGDFMRNEAVTKHVGALVDELILGGIRDVVISPGSRNTPISLIFMEKKRFRNTLTLMSGVPLILDWGYQK